jgi:hypothetical protein
MFLSVSLSSISRAAAACGLHLAAPALKRTTRNRRRTCRASRVEPDT